MVKKLFLAAVILIAFLSVYPLLFRGLPPTHDGEYHVIRFYEFNKTLSDGNPYPRWAQDFNNGFGVPLFNYVYPFPNYVSSLLHIFNISFIDAFKLNMFFATILGSVFFFLWTKQFWGNLGALVSSSFYIFSPYHLLDIYIRGSVGEVWAISFMPGFLWSITKFIKEKNIKFASLASVFLALLIFSHNILALMFIFFGFIYSILLLKDFSFRFLSGIFRVFILGIGLSSIFWLPALFERGYVRGLEIYDYSSNFPEFYQLIIPSWGSGFTGGDLQNQLSYQVGIANLIAIFFSIIILFKKNFTNRRVVVFFLSTFSIVFILMLKISEPIWKIVPLINYFQFPWRFLSIEIIACSLLAGAVATLWNKKIISVLLIMLAVSLGLGYANFAYYHQRDDQYYINRSNFIDGTNSPGNTFNTIWAGNLMKQKQKIIFSSGKVSNGKFASAKYSFHLNSDKGGPVIINTLYFPGWVVYIDGNLSKTKIEKEGNFSFIVPQGRHNILIIFENTPLRNVATFISLVFIVLLLLNHYRFVKIKK